MNSTLFTSNLHLGALSSLPEPVSTLNASEQNNKKDVITTDKDFVHTSTVHNHEELDHLNESVFEDDDFKWFDDITTGFIVVNRESTPPPPFEV